MSSLNIHIHIQSSCHAHDQGRHHGGEKNLREGIAAVIVLALLERLMQAASQGGARHGHGCHSGSGGMDAGHAGASAQAGSAGQAGAVQPGAKNGEGQIGVLQQFTALLILLALLSGQQGRHGHAKDFADRFSDKLADKLADKLLGGSDFGPGAAAAPDMNGPSLTAPKADVTDTSTTAPEADVDDPSATAPEADVDEPSTTAPEADVDEPSTTAPEADSATAADYGGHDAVSMMVKAMRDGHADSLMAGQDDAGFERNLQQMAADLRQELNSR